MANDIKAWKSWHRLHELKNQAFVNAQIKSHFNEMISIGFYTSVFDKMIARDKPIGEKLVAGYLNKTIHAQFRR